MATMPMPFDATLKDLAKTRRRGAGRGAFPTTTDFG
jgi:hypothetical protein